MKNIAIIDADLISRKQHRFPNLACMKMSGYEKEIGNNVTLITNYSDLFSKYNILDENEEYIVVEDMVYYETIKINNKKETRWYSSNDLLYDKIIISKVFTESQVPERLLELPICKYGGTGFFYADAPSLPDEIEHHMPDYHLYDRWVEEMISKGWNEEEFEYYTKYSIGFTTRGCFRKCSFCVNQKYDRVLFHSPIEEFLDESRPYICLLDDNILGFGQWEQIIDSLIATKKRFQYKQGMDMRVMTERKAEKLSKVKYIGDYIFAFDNISEKEEIERNLHIWRKYCGKATKFYVLCAYDEREKSNDEEIKKQAYDENFWVQDIVDTFKRIYILAKYNCKPYIMRYYKYENSPHRGIYINIASWGNQPQLLKKMSFRQYSIERGMKGSIYKQYKNKYDEYIADGYKKGACWRYMEDFANLYPEIANKYFDTHYYDLTAC